VFGAQDSYYEHDGQVYCHYHYSTQFAQRCNGCQTAILKQFVEIFRNGQNQHWHPECYMIHKFWNVRLASSQDATEIKRQLENTTDEEGRNQVREEEERMEEKVYRIWSVLSTFEESSAACISDMLLHVSNGAYVDGVLVAKKFIWHVDILFHSADKLDANMTRMGSKGKSFVASLESTLILTYDRTFVLTRSKALMQEDRGLLFSLVKDPRDRCSKARSHSGASCSGYWPCTLSQASYPDLSSRSTQDGTGAEELRWTSPVPG
jgi:hypothetical protein